MNRPPEEIESSGWGTRIEEHEALGYNTLRLLCFNFKPCWVLTTVWTSSWDSSCVLFGNIEANEKREPREHMTKPKDLRLTCSTREFHESWKCGLRASKRMKSGFYYTNPKRKRSIKPLKVLFKYIFTIKWQKMAIIILVLFPMIFLWFSYDFQ